MCTELNGTLSYDNFLTNSSILSGPMHKVQANFRQMIASYQVQYMEHWTQVEPNNYVNQ